MKTFKKQYTNAEKIAYYRQQIEFASRRIESLEKIELRNWVKALMEERQAESLAKRKTRKPKTG